MITDPPAVLVTGASRGLGRGVALSLARAGMSVAVHYATNQDAAAATAAACRAVALTDRQRFPIVRGDLADSAQRDAVWDEAAAALGHVDALVNNAGMASPGRLDALEASEDAWDAVMALNLQAPYFLAKRAANHWLANTGRARLPGGFKLVFVSSVSATMASLNRGDYCISKAGLAMANQVWALRLAEHGIQTIEFRPGIMETDMTAAVKEKYDPIITGGKVPMRRWGKPEDLGVAVRSFLEGGFPFSTGEAVYLDGGLHLPLL